MKSKIKIIAFWTVVVVYLFVSSGYRNKENLKQRCNDISVSIVDKTGNEFVDKKHIEKVLKKSRIKYKNYFKNIDIQRVERALELDPSIKKAEVYYNADSKLYINVEQKQPVVRIINSTKRGFYLNSDGSIMPLSNNYTSRSLIVSGNINYSYSLIEKKNIKDLKEYPFLRKLFVLSRYIYRSEFWRSQIQQIYVKSNLEIELIPRVGAHIIEFGRPVKIKDKLSKLFLMYEKGFSSKGWNKYDKINLKYEGQVVCEKR